MWVPASSPTGRSGGGGTAAAARPGGAASGAAVVPRLSKVTPKMGWNKIKTMASEDQQNRAKERGPMDVDQMLNVWKKGAPMKARMNAMFSKAKNVGNLMRRRGSVQPNLTVETDIGADNTDGPASAPPGNKRSLKSVFGRVKNANTLRSPSSMEKYAVAGASTTDDGKSTRPLKSVFGSVRDANALARSVSKDNAHQPVRSAWAESPSKNAAPGELRDDDGTAPR